jgi:hypothetical protein
MARVAGIISPTIIYQLYSTDPRIPLAFFALVVMANLVNVYFCPADKTGKPLDGRESMTKRLMKDLD